MKALIGGLLESNEGYNITIVSPDSDSKPLPNTHHIHLEKTYELLFSSDLDLMEMNEQSAFETAKGLFDYSAIICEGPKHTFLALYQCFPSFLGHDTEILNHNFRDTPINYHLDFYL
jgi:hypothetical protein